MQSKLPVRINKRHILEKRECNCCKIFQTMLKNPGDGICNFCLHKELSTEELGNKCRKKPHSKPFQSTAQNAFANQPELLTEVKQILSNINSNLEAILLLLKDRKEYFYNQLQESNIKNKKPKNDKKEKLKKNNELVRTQPYRWPDISRLYCGSPFWIKHCVQHNPDKEFKRLVLCPFRRNILYIDKPFSCPNINYFQTMGKIFDDHNISISMYSFPIITLSSHLDIDDEDHTGNENVNDTNNKEIFQIK